MFDHDSPGIITFSDSEDVGFRDASVEVTCVVSARPSWEQIWEQFDVCCDPMWSSGRKKQAEFPDRLCCCCPIDKYPPHLSPLLFIKQPTVLILIRHTALFQMKDFHSKKKAKESG